MALPARKFRTAARLTSKPVTPFEQNCAGYDAGRSDALAGRPARRGWRCEDFAEGYGDGYARVARNGMTGR
jgi:hypothetical protein